MSSFNLFRELIEKARAAVKDGRSSVVTKKNKTLLTAEETINQITYDLNNAMAEVLQLMLNNILHGTIKLLNEAVY